MFNVLWVVGCQLSVVRCGLSPSQGCNHRSRLTSCFYKG